MFKNLYLSLGLAVLFFVGGNGFLAASEGRGRETYPLALSACYAELNKTYKEALTAAQKIGDVYLRSWELKEIAKAMARAGRFDEAIEAAEKIKEPGDYSQALSVISEELSRDCQKERAIKLLKQALKSAEKISSKSKKVEVLSEIASALASVGQKEEAGKILEQASKLAQEAKQEWEWQSLSFLILSNMLNMGQFEKAMETAQQIKDDFARAEALCIIAGIMAFTPQREKALKILEQAIGTVEKASDLAYPNEYIKPQTLCSIAGSMVMMGEKERALKMLEEALTLSQKIKDYSEHARILTNIAEIYSNAGEKEKAFNLLSKAIESAEKIVIEPSMEYFIEEATNAAGKCGIKIKISTNYMRAEALSEIAKVMSEVGRKKEALSIFRRALKYAQEIKNELENSHTLNQIVSNMAWAGFPKEAFDVAKKIRNPYKRLDALATVISVMKAPSANF